MSKIEVRNVSKLFGRIPALRDVNLTFEENRIYGLLGRNGAGKSTLLNLITNRLFPTEGSICVDGESVVENDRALSKIYGMSERPLYPPSMKVREVLYWSSQFYPDFDMAYARKLAESFQLPLEKKVSGLSTGYSSIYKIVVALSCNANFIFLDEPVLGLDANHRELFYKALVDNYASHPKTFVLSTHLIEEASDLLEHVIILKEGHVILDETTEQVLARGFTVSGPSAAVDAFTAGRRILGCDTLGGLKTAYLMENLQSATIPQGLEVSKMDLQKLFIHLTNV